jgi:hypothetical protein
MEKCNTEKWLIQQMWNMRREMKLQSFSYSSVSYLRNCKENYERELKRFREFKSIESKQLIPLENNLRNYLEFMRTDGCIKSTEKHRKLLGELYCSIPCKIRIGDFIDKMLVRPTWNVEVTIAFLMTWVIERLYNTIP